MEPDHKYGYVYILDCGNGDWKIGSTTQVLKRLQDHRHYFGDTAQMLMVIKCDSPTLAYQIEQWIHCWNWEHHRHREFFALGWMSNDQAAVDAFVQRLYDRFRTELHLRFREPIEPSPRLPASGIDPVVNTLSSPCYWYAPQPLPRRPFQAMSEWSLSRPGVRETRRAGAARGESLSQTRRKMWADLTPEKRAQRIQNLTTALNKPETKLKHSETQRQLMRDPDLRQRAIQALRDAAKRPKVIASRRELMLRRNADPAYQRKAQSGRWRSFKSRGVSPNQLKLFDEDTVMLTFQPMADPKPKVYTIMDFLDHTALWFAEEAIPLSDGQTLFRMSAYVKDPDASKSSRSHTTICQIDHEISDGIDNLLAYKWECRQASLQWLMDEAQKAGYIPGTPAPIYPRTDTGSLLEGFAVRSRTVQLEQKPRSVTENCFVRDVA
jgi:predicted GIY-YIG superfamily endonuclease